MRMIIPLVTAAAVTFTATACSSSNADTAPPPSTNVASSTDTSSSQRTTTSALSTTTGPGTTTPTGAELTEAVSAFWALYDELGASKAPFDPAIRTRLEERATGDELVTLFNYFQSNALSGYYIDGGIESSLTIVSATDAEATVRDCYDDLSGLYRISNDERVDVDDPARHQVVYTLVNESGVWKVSKILDEGSGCVVSS